MFRGSVPADLRAIIAEQSREWPREGPVYVGCSGNFTIERVLHSVGLPAFGNDVQAYSSALGWFLSGKELPFRLKPETAAELPWLTPYLDGAEGTLASIMIGTRFLQWVGKAAPYYQRMVAATEEQFPEMHSKTVAKLRALDTRLAGYYCGDVRDYLRGWVPASSPVAMFPPFFAGDYESQFAAIDKHFDWPQPEYPELDEDGKDELVDLVVDRERWVLGLHVERPQLARYLRGLVQTTNRGVPIYVYAAGGPSRLVRPKQALEPIRMPKIGHTEELGDGMRLHVLTGGQFAMIRSQFMSKSIRPGQPLLACGVSVAGRIVGAFAYLPPKFDPNVAYLMSDFPVSWSRYRRLAKLIVMAGMSREAQLLLQRSLNRRILACSTTAFADNPQSSKYGRGVPGMKLQKRTQPAGDGVHAYQLQYGGPIGAWTCDEALVDWKKRHGKDQRR